MTSICLTFDFDAVALWVSSFRQTTATPVSRGEYGARVGVPRILDLLERKGIAATFFVPAHTAAAFPEALQSILARGHEIGLHGYCHETPIGLSRAEEADLLDRAIDKLGKAVGGGFRPSGYRSPAWDLSSDSIALMEERGLVYDSSMMADDFRPYRARKGHRADEHGYDPGELSTIVEMPVAWELDDFPYFCFTNRPLYPALRSPEEVLAIWQAEFDFCHTLGEGVFTLTMHPQIIGRGPRIAMLERLIDHMAAADGASFSTLGAEAARQATRLLSTPDDAGTGPGR